MLHLLQAVIKVGFVILAPASLRHDVFNDSGQMIEQRGFVTAAPYIEVS
jgi:hypothetical protein